VKKAISIIIFCFAAGVATFCFAGGAAG